MKDNLFQNYVAFGQLLRKIRQDSKNSLADVSAAIEYSQEKLAKMEKGNLKPSRDVVLLLIHFFQPAQDKAEDLIRLAGYQGVIKRKGEESNQSRGGDSPGKHSSLEIVFGADPKQVWVGINDSRIMHTDLAQISSNETDVVINFQQSLGNHEQPVSVSRVGMSLNCAAQLAKQIQAHIDRLEDKTEDSDK